MSFLFYLRWSLYHPVINLGLLFFSGGYPATLSEKEYIKFLEKKQVFSLKKAIPSPTYPKMPSARRCGTSVRRRSLRSTEHLSAQVKR